LQKLKKNSQIRFWYGNQNHIHIQSMWKKFRKRVKGKEIQKREKERGCGCGCGCVPGLLFSFSVTDVPRWDRVQNNVNYGTVKITVSF
jgi:hypothetical protein